MNPLVKCPICESDIDCLIGSRPYCSKHGVFGWLRRVWWASGIPAFFQSL